MKKTLLTCLVITLNIYLGFTQVSTGNYATSHITNDLNGALATYVTVHNNNTSTISMQVERIIDYLVPGHQEAFCFGISCYTPGTDFSIDPVVLAPGDSNRSFHTTVTANGFAGTTQLSFRFFDENNMSDSTSITMDFIFDPNFTSISENNRNSYLHFNSPVNNFAVFSYSLPELTNNSRIEIFNMLGKVVKNIPIAEKSGVTVITTSELQSGLYLCSVISNSKVSKTYKLVVAHK